MHSQSDYFPSYYDVNDLKHLTCHEHYGWMVYYGRERRVDFFLSLSDRNLTSITYIFIPPLKSEWELFLYLVFVLVFAFYPQFVIYFQTHS